MTAKATLAATQPAAGAPLSITAMISAANNADFLAWSSGYLLLTATSAPPTTFGGATFSEKFDQFSTNPDAASDQTSAAWSPGNTMVAFSDVTRITAFKRLDSNFVAGRYMWFASFASAPPSSGDAPLSLSTPYHIL